MRVARLYDFGDIRVEQSARPEPGPGDILVRTRACGICSGDIMPWYIRRKAPLVLGHEPVGVVEEIGRDVSGFKPGERVFVHHHAPSSGATHAGAASTCSARPGVRAKSRRAVWRSVSSSTRPTCVTR